MCSTLCLVGKLVCRRTIFGSVANPAHATATMMHFPANAGLIFLTDELTNDRYLVDTGETLSIVPGNQNSSLSIPLLKGADGQPIPSWGFIQKTLQFQGKLFTSSFLQAAVAGPILGIDFLRKFKFTAAPEINQIQFACTAVASPAPDLPSAALSALLYLFIFPQAPAPVPIMLPGVAISSQPPAISAHEVRNPEVKSSSFSSRENKSLLDPPPLLFSKIPDSVLADVKTLLQKFPSILRSEDMKPTPTHGVKHHIHTSCHPPVLAKSCSLDPEKFQIAKAEFKNLESAGIIRRSKLPWASPLHMVSKKDGSLGLCGHYRSLNLMTTPGQVPFAKHAGPFQWPAWLYSVFKNKSCQGLSPNPCRNRRHPQNCNHYAIWFV